MFNIFVGIAIGITLLAVAQHFVAQPGSTSNKVWAWIVAAAAWASTLITSIFHSGTPTQ